VIASLSMLQKSPPKARRGQSLFWSFAAVHHGSVNPQCARVWRFDCACGESDGLEQTVFPLRQQQQTSCCSCSVSCCALTEQALKTEPSALRRASWSRSSSSAPEGFLFSYAGRLTLKSEACSHVQGELDELEREEFFRLKKVQKKKKKDEEARLDAKIAAVSLLFGQSCALQEKAYGRVDVFGARSQAAEIARDVGGFAVTQAACTLLRQLQLNFCASVNKVGAANKA